MNKQRLIIEYISIFSVSSFFKMSSIVFLEWELVVSILLKHEINYFRIYCLATEFSLSFSRLKKKIRDYTCNLDEVI